MLGLGQKILSPQILPPPFFGPCQGRILVGLTQKKIGYFAHFFFQNLTKIYIFFRHFGPFQVCSCDQGRICCIIFSLFFFDVFWVFFFHFGCFFFHLDHHLFQPWSPRSKRWCHFFNQHGPTSSLKSPNPLKKNPSKKGKASNRGGGKEVQQNVSWNLFETPPPYLVDGWAVSDPHWPIGGSRTHGWLFIFKIKETKKTCVLHLTLIVFGMLP